MADFSKLAFKLLNHPAASNGKNNLSMSCVQSLSRGGGKTIPKQETVLKSNPCKNKNQKLTEIM